jgi:uncharacterized protein YggE
MRSIALVAGLILLSGTTRARADGKAVRSVSVSGTVETKVAPDQIRWQISLTATDQNLSKAKARSDEQARAVVALRPKLGIEEGDLNTGAVSIGREYDRDERGSRGNFKHFIVTRTVTIRQRDLKRFDEFLSALVESTEMEVYFNFESSRLQEIRGESRLKALQVAKQKAKAMAESLGEKLGRVLTIAEHAPIEGGRSAVSNAVIVQSSPPADLATETFVPGAIIVPLTVYVTFELK